MKTLEILCLVASLAVTVPAVTAAVLPVEIEDDDAGAEGDERGAPLDAFEQARLGAFEQATGPAAPVSDPVLDPQHVIPAQMLADALAYYQKNAARIPNKDFLTVVDFSRASSQARMFLLDMRTGRVTAVHMAHGSGSDPRNTGRATVFSNESGSNCSSLGFYLTAETYTGKHGYSCRLDGLSSMNSNVRPRAVVIHGADYVRDVDVKQGRSWGCLAVSMALRTSIIDRLKGGSLIHAARY